ncbi:hypothetical protein [Salinarimonas chemoclinalis]|uniref:hypothetical protein n=1 Tax=Salinarimonas chemoclinalis TaxID=3241599 RepID=UPI0035587A07
MTRASQRPRAAAHVLAATLLGASAFAGEVRPATAQDHGAIIEICSPTGNIVNVRRGPGIEFDVLASLENATMLRVKSGDPRHAGAWVEVQLIDDAQAELAGSRLRGFVWSPLLRADGMCDVLHDPAVAGLPSSRIGTEGGRLVTLGPWDPTHDMILRHDGHPQVDRLLAAADAYWESNPDLEWNPYPDEPTDTEVASGGGDPAVAAAAPRQDGAAARPQATTPRAGNAADIAARLKAAFAAMPEGPQGPLTLIRRGTPFATYQYRDGTFVGSRHNGMFIARVDAPGIIDTPYVSPNGSGPYVVVDGSSVLQVSSSEGSDKIHHVDHNDAQGRRVSRLGGAAYGFVEGIGMPRITGIFPSGDGRAFVHASLNSKGDSAIYVTDGRYFEEIHRYEASAPLSIRRFADGAVLVSRHVDRGRPGSYVVYEYFVLEGNDLVRVHTHRRDEAVPYSILAGKNGRAFLLQGNSPDNRLYVADAQGLRLIGEGDAGRKILTGSIVVWNDVAAWLETWEGDCGTHRQCSAVMVSDRGGPGVEVARANDAREGSSFSNLFLIDGVPAVNWSNELAVVVDGTPVPVGERVQTVLEATSNRLVLLDQADVLVTIAY